MDAIGWDSIEDGLWTWVQGTSGLAADHVLWSYKTTEWPSEPYISLDITELDDVGGFDWRIRNPSPDQPVVAGQELQVLVKGHRTAVLELQCHGAKGAGTAPMRVLSNVMSGLRANFYALNAAGVGIGQVEKIQGGGATRSSMLLPRAIGRVHLHVGSSVESRTTYITSANVAVAAKNIKGDTIDTVNVTLAIE